MKPLKPTHVRLSAAISACVALAAGAQEVPAVDEAAVERAKSAFVERMVSKHELDAAEVSEALASAEIQTKILETIARPAERVVPWHEYREIFLTEKRIADGAAFWKEHADTISAVSARYGVAPEIIVAIIGVETFYGQRMGSYRVLDALATLAFAYPPRSAFFTSELEAFMLLAREEGVGLYDALGSYAGAMGAGQFIPSSFRAYAVDADEDGRRDLWRDWDDILGSVANYFKIHGWRAGEPVADPATRTRQWSGHTPKNGLDLEHTVAGIEGLGYEFSTGEAADEPATIMSFEAPGGAEEYWVGYHNFRVITRYNRSTKYALAAHQLSQAIRAEYERSSVATAAGESEGGGTGDGAARSVVR